MPDKVTLSTPTVASTAPIVDVPVNAAELNHAQGRLFAKLGAMARKPYPLVPVVAVKRTRPVILCEGRAGLRGMQAPIAEGLNGDAIAVAYLRAQADNCS